MIHKRWLAIVQTKAETWVECQKLADEITDCFASPMVISSYQIDDSFFDGEKVVEKYETKFIYGLKLSFYLPIWKRLNLDGYNVVDSIITIEFKKNWLPFSGAFQRKPF